jgi:hypothetical protein
MTATMLRVDETILESNKIICRQISRLGESTRGEVSQEILESLQHFAEHILLKVYADGNIFYMLVMTVSVFPRPPIFTVNTAFPVS